MDKTGLTSAQEQSLRQQEFSPVQPGTILHDFQMLLDYVGPSGVDAAGKYNMLPIKSIGELDQRLSRPLHLDLKRPQVRSHPYIQGLNLLLRASGLTRVETTGKKARLIVDPEMNMHWEQLNPTERYFNLLEAWLRFGRGEMVGERGGGWQGFLSTCMNAWESLRRGSRKPALQNSMEIGLFGFYREFYILALMDLFGLVELIHPARPVTPWIPSGLKQRTFGDAVFTLLAPVNYGRMAPVILGLEADGQEGSSDDEYEDDEDVEAADIDEDDYEDDEETEMEQPSFGAWQPIFQPYFPAWQNNLVLPDVNFRQGTFVFRVSLGQIWRLIAMPAKSTLYDLVDMILRSLKFDDDHLHQFSYRNRMGATVMIHHPGMNEPPYTDEIRIGSLPLDPGQSMGLVYDFGDNWQFAVKLERIDPPDSTRKLAASWRATARRQSSIRTGTSETVRDRRRFPPSNPKEEMAEVLVPFMDVCGEDH